MPLSDHAESLEQHLELMYNELVDNYETYKSQEISLYNKTQKIDSLNNENLKLRSQIVEQEKSKENFYLALTRLIRETPEEKKLDELNRL